jgi:CRP-like cAMP-binding protein
MEVSANVPMSYRNRILAALPPDELATVEPHLERIPLTTRMVLCDPGRPIQAVVFPEDAIVSQIAIMADGSAIETATVGSDGMSGLSLFHGVDQTPEQAFVQVPGEGYRMSAEAFRGVLPRCPTLVATLHRFAQALFTLVAQSSGCNRKHSVDQRCARWLLLVHDRVGRDRWELTQLFLSQMLGVRRASVTVAAGALQKAGAIRYTRGRIEVVDRARLEAASCECYAVIRSVSDQLMGGEPTTSPLFDVTVSEDGLTTAGDGTPFATAAR